MLKSEAIAAHAPINAAYVAAFDAHEAVRDTYRAGNMSDDAYMEIRNAFEAAREAEFKAFLAIENAEDDPEVVEVSDQIELF